MQRLAITLGDPAGIGTEVVLRALAQLTQENTPPIVLFGSARLTRVAADTLSVRFDAPAVRDLAAANAPIVVFDVGDDVAAFEFGRIDAACGAVALRSIDAAIGAIESGVCNALVTAPLHKAAIRAAGAEFPGHTELLAARAGLDEYGRDFAMYFDSPQLRVALLTVHVPLSEAIRSVTHSNILALARLLHREFQRLYGRTPNIGVAGLNPHAGESGQFGGEEEEIVLAVKSARTEGIDISGPHAADTIFMQALRGAFDVVLSLYHDQGLIAVKTVAFDRSVNVTLGLPYLRASVDHGTAFDIAGKGIADAAPMLYTIEWALRHCDRYSR